MSTLKMFGFTAAALFCLAVAQPVSAATGCPAISTQGDEEIMSRAQPAADAKEANVTKKILDETRNAGGANTLASSTNQEGPEPSLVACNGVICCFEVWEITCCVSINTGVGFCG
jgi:hypothetical protein